MPDAVRPSIMETLGRAVEKHEKSGSRQRRGQSRLEEGDEQAQAGNW